MAAEPASLLDNEPKVKTLEIPADESQLSRVRDFVAEVCEEANFSARETNNTKLAVDEACTNIIKHAYSDTEGEIKIKAIIKPGWIDITLFDRGTKFDFAGVKDPDLNQYVESGKKGGLGIFLINRLMDNVDYQSTEAGNELTLTKRSRSAISRALPGRISWRSSLRFKFTLRAGLGLFLLISLIGGFTLVHQTRSIREQKASMWLESRRLAGNLANKSKDLLLKPEEFSIEQTNLGAYLAKLLEGNGDIAYVRVVDNQGRIMSSSRIEEIFSRYSSPPGDRLGEDADGVVWRRLSAGDRAIRDISYPVKVRNTGTNRFVTLGTVHLGVYEDAVESGVDDPRLATMITLLAVFLLGVLLIMLLVSIFVKPIQVLSDGVRAIGEGSFGEKIPIDGPAEIGAIAAVFNEITQKFKKAQDSILEQEKLHKEMEVAKQIQQSLLPKNMPAVSGYDIATLYHAAAEVGGDYYDFVQVDDDTIGVVVADVSGKGVPGSLVMTMIRTALRMEARGNKNASDVMARMNDFVTDDMRKGMFVTMFYVILDSKNRIISYASAGHNPMILYRHETNETYFLNPKGFPVGINLPDQSLFRKSINVEKIKLKKDDMLVIYTDGVTEAMNEKREQYGEERLLEVIKKYGHMHPKEFISNLENDIRKFTGGNPQNDDITIVAVKEKLTADEVLYGIRKRLIDMVDKEGLSVREACARMKVSPATYYRYKKRLELMGERGLKNKILRQDQELKRVSLEDRKEILRIIREHPEYGAKRITEEVNKGKDPSRLLKERTVYEELKRLNLNTKELRLDYLKRYRLVSEGEGKKGDEAVDRKRMVEEFIKEVSQSGLPQTTEGEAGEGGSLTSEERSDLALDFKALEEAGVTMEKTEGDVSILHVHGHLDSVSTAGFERSLAEVIKSGEYKIIVDLSEVSYISSGGWGIFTGEVKKLREKGGDVVLVGMAPEVYDVFELLGFGEILMAFHTVDEAKDYFRKPAEERFTPRTVKTSASHEPSFGEGGIVEEEIPGESYVPDWESLRIEASTVGESGDVAVLSLDGIIDTVSAELLRRSLDNVISKGIYRIVVDMSQVEYVSSGGWGAFTERLREVRRNDGDIKLFGMDPDVYYVFTMLGFNIVLSSFDILSEAIEDFGRESKDVHDMSHLDVTLDAPEPESSMETEDDVEEDLACIGETVEGETPAGSSAYAGGSSSFVQWVEAEKGILVARLSGAIEASTIERLDGEISARTSGRSGLLLFNLADVSYISSAGWGIFARLHEVFAAEGGVVALCCLSQSLFEIYSCLEFHSFIKAYASESEAIDAFRGALGSPGVPGGGPAGAANGGPGAGETASSRVSGGGDEGDVHGTPADTQRIEEEIMSIDEILGGDDEEEAGTKKKAGGDWEDFEAEESPAKRRSETTAPEIVRSVDDDLVHLKKKPVDEGPTPKSEVRLDLDKAVEKGGMDEDRKLREMGWGKYGEKLEKSRAKRKKHKKDEE